MARQLDSNRSDETLVAEFQKGSQDSFEELISRYADKAYGMASRLVRNPEDAEEVIQDVFTTVFRKVEGFEGKSSFSSWLYRITVNAALMKIRKRKQERAVLIEDVMPSFKDSAALRVNESQNADHLAYRRQLGEALKDAISRLPEEYRPVYLLRDVDGLSSEEVGKILGISIPAVKSRLHRSRLMLRRRLAKLYRELGLVPSPGEGDKVENL